MTTSPRQPVRGRIGLGALLAAFGFVALWLGWSRAVNDLLDAAERARAAVSEGPPHSASPSS